MKIVIIIILILILLFGYLVFLGRKQKHIYEENINLLTVENYLLIKNSPYADELSKYRIIRRENELRFTRKDKGYTLFFLKLENNKPKDIKLIGLDGYGIRDQEFLKYTGNLIRKIIEKNKQISSGSKKE